MPCPHIPCDCPIVALHGLLEVRLFHISTLHHLRAVVACPCHVPCT
jgi:hypothetical protein